MRLKKIPIASTLLLLFLIASAEISLYITPMNHADAQGQRFIDLLRLSAFQSSSQCLVSVQSWLGDWFHLLSPLNKVRITVVNPVFTAAAYNGYPTKSFYGFYKKYSNVPKNTIVKTDLNLLNSSVHKDDWGHSYGLYYFVESKVAKNAGIVVGNNTSILTDIDVNDGKLFYSSDGTRRFDVAVLGFSEYVTASEYQSYKRFVETGGGLFFLDSTNFLAEVKYNRATNKVSLVKGHGWIFNGTAAWKGPYHRWYAENTNWIGSNNALFHTEGYHINGAVPNTTHPLSVLLRSTFGLRVFSSYFAHEENAVTNSSDRVIAYWNITGLKSRNLTVAVYEHEYRKGIVIHTGIFGSDIIYSDREMQFFLAAALRRLASHTVTSIAVPEFQLPGIILALTVGMLLAGFSYSRKRRRE